MACKSKASSVPLPCQQLAQLLAQRALLAAGGGIRAIEAPGLGRVEYQNAPDLGQLQAQIDRLAAECAAAGGDPTAMGCYGGRRKPINLEAWP